MENSGLTQPQAHALLAAHGYNELAAAPKHSALRRLGRVLSEPTLLVLLLVLAIYLFMGSVGEAGLLSVFVLLVVAITAWEENRTEKAVEALRYLASPRAVVRRDGEWVRLPGREVVPGDQMLLHEGDRVAADGLLTDAHDLCLDESHLTGESQGVWKQAGDGPEEERMIFAGSLVAQGQGQATVTATGRATRIGQISRGLAEIQPDLTPFQKAARQVVRALAWTAAICCVLVLGLAMMNGDPFIPALLQSLTLAMALVPEELPVVLVVFLALGARRLSVHNVLARRIPAVETLGAITLLAVDKTGTLTSHEMKLKAVDPAAGRRGDDLLRAAARACEPDPTESMEKEILLAAGTPQGRLTHEYALSGRPPRMGHVWDGRELAVKGAVEAVLNLCRLKPGEKEAVLARAAELAGQGLRLLGVARGSLDGAPPPEIPDGLDFLGIVGFEDPIRPGTREALGYCRQAGIRVVMMTGDSRETAKAVAHQVGFERSENAVLGGQLSESPARVAAWAGDVDVFARLRPEQKQILVKAWTASGEVVGMTGDGVNDAPALTQAQVGIAMGQRGTDVARESASVVLGDDSFASLVEGVRLGRQTTDRILRAARFIVAVHIPIIGVVLACLLAKLQPLITAAQVAFLELFIGPACSLIFERAPVGAEVMLRPPRDPGQPLLPLRQLGLPLLQGLAILGLVWLQYRGGLGRGFAPEQARSEAFLLLLVADLMLCWTLLSPLPFWKRERWNNPTFWLVSGGVLALMFSLLQVPALSALFRMEPLGGSQIARSCGLAAAAALWLEFFKFGNHRLPDAPGAG